MAVSAIIADDHGLTRQGIRSLLEDRFDVNVVAETGSGLEVFPLVQEHGPDVLVLDLGLSHLSGLEVLRKMRNAECSVEAVMLAMHEEDPFVRNAFELGASAYVLKGAPIDELIEALKTAVRGGRYVSDALSRDLMVSPSSERGSNQTEDESLTGREREVLLLTAEGYVSREIGEYLDVSPRTVDKHRQHIRKKLGLENVVEMAAYVYREELLPSTPALREGRGPQPGSSNRSSWPRRDKRRETE